MAQALSARQHTTPLARPLRTLYLVRAVIALSWAAALVAAGTDMGAAATALLVFYPLLDAAASLADARINNGTAAASTQYVNVGISGFTAIAVATAATFGTATAIAVFGVWAVVSGSIQLYLALRRRRELEGQWAMLLSGSGSTIAGITFFAAAAAGKPDLMSLAAYATVGAVFYIVSAARLGRVAAN